MTWHAWQQFPSNRDIGYAKFGDCTKINYIEHMFAWGLAAVHSIKQCYSYYVYNIHHL